MSKRIIPLCTLVLIFCSAAFAQDRPSPGVYGDPLNSIAADLNKISASVQALNARLKSFVDKFENIGGMTFSENSKSLSWHWSSWCGRKSVWQLFKKPRSNS